MNIGALLIVAGILFFVAGIPILLLRVKQLSRNYGPKEPARGNSRAGGTLLCRIKNAPALGKSPRFAYELNLKTEGDDFFGEYRYPPESDSQKTIYAGRVCWSARQGRIRGRLAGIKDRKVLEGRLLSGKFDLERGFPKGSGLAFLNSPFQFRIEKDRVRFIKTDNGQGCIAPDSHLDIRDNAVSGRLIHSRESWMIDVDVVCKGAAPEWAVLAILLMGDDILDFHHD